MPGFQDIIKALSREKVKFVIIGGMAAVAQGAPITTFDLDICYERSIENIKILVEALKSFNPRPRDFPKDLPWQFNEKTILMGCNFTFSTEEGHLDLLGEIHTEGSTLSYTDLSSRAEELEIFGYSVKVMSLDDLIKVKEGLKRFKDIVMLEILKELKRLKEGSS